MPPSAASFRNAAEAADPFAPFAVLVEWVDPAGAGDDERGVCPEGCPEG